MTEKLDPLEEALRTPVIHQIIPAIGWWATFSDDEDKEVAREPVVCFALCLRVDNEAFYWDEVIPLIAGEFGLIIESAYRISNFSGIVKES